MKIDFHVHSVHSPDSINSAWLLNKFCSKRGITPVISDHNRIEFAQRYKKRFGNAIVAEEIMTTSGEVICLFANEWVRHHLPVEETIDRIREQGALVYVPHPFDSVRPSSMKKIYFKPDIIEIFNSRNLDKSVHHKALKFANDNGFLKAVGSDAHFPHEIGNSYAEMEEFNSIKEFKKNLKEAKLVTRYSPTIGYPMSVALGRFRRVFFSPRIP